MNAPNENFMTQVSRRPEGRNHRPIAVVIPAYRSEQHILRVLNGIPQFISFIVVVNDCSPDSTTEIVQACADPRVHLVSHKKNQGVGGATLSGYQKSIELGAEIIVKMDSDGQMDPTYIIQLIAPILINQADYTKGNRFLHIDELKSMPLIRRFGNAGLSFLTKAASGYWNIFDPTNGYTAIHASIIPALDTNKVDRRYFFESSMLIELGKIRAVIQDVQIPAKYQDEVSSLSEWKALFEFPPRLLSGFLRRLLTQYFIRDFGVFSMLLVLGLSFSIFGILFGLYHWYLSDITSTIASTGTVMIAVLPLILGSQLLIQSLIVDMQNVPVKPIHININIIKDISQEMSRQDADDLHK
jgi:dolichol-phosphate mannosyltransferase